MSDVKRYDAVHLRYEENNIRYSEGCEVEVVAAYDHDRVAQERDTLLAQVATLQSDANSWQSGYDKGRKDGDRHAREERDQLRAEVERLRGALRNAGKGVHWLQAHVPMPENVRTRASAIRFDIGAALSGSKEPAHD